MKLKNEGSKKLDDLIININEDLLSIYLTEFDINFEHKEDGTILNIVTTQGYIDALKFILKQKDINVNSTDGDGYTPLMITIKRKYYNIIKILLERDDIIINTSIDDHIDGEFISTLGLAAKSDNNDIIKMVCMHKNTDINYRYIDEEDEKFNGETILVSLTRENNKEMIKYLLKRDDININLGNLGNHTPLKVAIDKNDADLVKLFLDDPRIIVNQKNAFKYTALAYAVMKKNPEIVEMLVKREDIDVNVVELVDLETPLMMAVIGGSLDIVKILMMRSDIDIYHINREKKDVVDLISKNDYKIYKKILKLIKQKYKKDKKKYSRYMMQTGIVF